VFCYADGTEQVIGSKEGEAIDVDLKGKVIVGINIKDERKMFCFGFEFLLAEEGGSSKDVQNVFIDNFLLRSTK